jgi:antitoxin MazE
MGTNLPAFLKARFSPRILSVYTSRRVSMTTTVQKWGNSLGIRVPKAVAEKVNFKQGVKIEFETGDDSLTVRAVRPSPRRRRRKLTFKELWGNYKGPSPHRDLDRDLPVGRELI